ncbi:MAG: IPT/TIG domain-containing protein [Planctomycetales bacterium]|nr:IPT/TIG domain-containing protein [Planctomycetales bacterium]
MPEMKPRLLPWFLGVALGLAASACADKRHGSSGGGAGTPPAAPAPTLSSVTPVSGPAAGGTAITLAGTDFQAGAGVAVGGVAATSVVFVSTTSLTAVTPAGAAGAANVVVTNPDSQSATLLNGFTYTSGGAPAPTLASISPSSGLTAGGQLVTLSGTGFQTGATVTFGGNAATSVTVLSAGFLTCLTPAGAAGPVAVVVTNPDAQSGGFSGGYTYVAAPTVSSLSPGSGDVAGGTPVTVSGASFATGATVTFGSAQATGVVVLSPSTITCATPAGSAGAVNVTVTNPTGLSGSLASGYTYTTGGTVPTVSSVSPGSGASAGGTLITVTGSSFQSGAGVTIGGAAATSVTFVNSTTLTAVTPPAPAGGTGALSVTVTNPGGASGTLPNSFTYLPTPVETSGDTAADPDVAVDGSGRVHVVWQRTTSASATDILYVRSTDGGQTWSATPMGLDSTANAVSRPRIAARGNTVVAVWNEGNSIFHAYSTDGGGTWATATQLPNGTGPMLPAFGGTVPNPDVAIDGSGNVVVAGVGTAAGPQATTYLTIYAMKGTAGGTFSNPVGVGGQQAGAPSIAADGNGLVVAVWDDHQVTGWMMGPVFAADRDIRTNNSTDGGATWSSSNTWLTTAGPSGVDSFAPGVALSGTNAVVVYGVGPGSSAPSEAAVARGSTDGGVTWGTPVTVTGGSTLAKTDPVVAADGSGAFHVAWSEVASAGSSRDIFSARTTDAGRTFTAKSNLLSNAGASIAPAVAGGSGSFVIHVWADDTASAGTFDILSR